MYQPLNVAEEFEEREWVNPDAPPYTYDIAEGVRMLDEPLPQEQIDELHRQALEEIERNDPTKQNYFMRLDTKSIIKTEKEYIWCREHGVRFKTVDFGQAREALRQEDARKRQEKKAKQKKKVSKKARRRNR